MSIAFLGCNPEQRWADSDKQYAPKLGTIGASDDGGLFMAVHADGTIAVNRICRVINNYEAAAADQANRAIGNALGVATSAFADNEYGWIQVYGIATGLAGAAIGADVDRIGLHGTANGDLIGAANCYGIMNVGTTAVADNDTF